MLQRTCLAGRLVFPAFRFSPSDFWHETYTPFPWFSSPLISHILPSPTLSPRPRCVYGQSMHSRFFTSSPPFYMRGSYSGHQFSIPLHEHPTTVHAVYLCCIPSSLFRLPCSISHLTSPASIHHPYFSSLSFFLQTYSSISSHRSGHK